MTEQDRADMKINGDGTMSGGTFGAITINGAGSVNGDADATDVRINGAGTINGKLVAQSITVNGTGTFNGSVQAGEMNVNGDASIRDGAGVGRFTIKGNTSVGGGLAANELDVRGFLRAGGDCEAESFSAEGGFTIGGLLNAGTIDIKVFGPCSAREIGGEKIVIRAPQGLQSITQIFTFWTEKRLEAQTIEGDEVTLEAVTAQTVRGANVTIGPECRIELVDYTGGYTVDPGASVGEARKVDVAG